MPKTIKIYCEGTKRSHDYEMLRKVVGGKNIFIHPIGSKRGAEEVIEVFEKTGKKTGAFLFFRDIDFDVAVNEKPSLIIENNIYYSYRTTIENYLLDAPCFFDFLKEKKLEKRFKIHSITDIQNIFIKAAKKISYYQALRHTIARMRPTNDDKTTWIKGNSGSLPYEMVDKLACRQKAFDFVKSLYSESEAPTEAAFDALLDTFCERFETAAFYAQAQYLIWFQGKDFAKSLSLLLPQCPIKDYYLFAKKHFDYTRFDDLVEFQKIIDVMMAN